jgi:hypothetical protein
MVNEGMRERFREILEDVKKKSSRITARNVKKSQVKKRLNRFKQRLVKFLGLEETK